MSSSIRTTMSFFRFKKVKTSVILLLPCPYKGKRRSGEDGECTTSFGHELGTCLRRRLVKTYNQFRESGCENCPFVKMDEDPEHVVDCTTPNLSGIISIMDPSRSWASRWFGIGRFVPNCYTLSVSEALPDGFQNICEDEHVQYIPPKRV